MRSGVLGFQGCIAPHISMLRTIGADPITVRTPEELWATERLIIPGGESTTMLKFLEREGMFNELVKYGTERAVWGVCAGSILMAKEVKHPEQKSLELLAVRAIRNYYGSQRESFEHEISVSDIPAPVRAQFIRAPALEVLDRGVEVLSQFDGQPILVRQGRLMASTFHTELGSDPAIHQLFLKL